MALAPLWIHGCGAPLGEPVADDFDFLHHALLLDRHSLLDGGGSQSFWRPLSTQVYYTLLGDLILARPGLVAVLHGLFLAASALLVFRIARRHWAGHWAAAAATFPLLSDSALALLESPSHFPDLGALFFGVLALHEAAFGRLATSMLSLAASLLCKEYGAVTAALLPWMPGVREGRIGRGRLIGAAAAVLLAWVSAYLYVRRHAGLELPHNLEGSLEIAETPWVVRFGWAFWNSLRAVVSLPAAPAEREAAFGLAVLAIGVLAAGSFLVVRQARARLKAALPWASWGGCWFLVFCVGLTAIYPIWAPYRSVFGSVGLGVAATSLLGAAHPGLLAAFVPLRLVALASSPGPPPLVTAEAPETGAFVDFERIVRLQRLMIDTRTALKASFPSLPAGARVGQHHLPRSALYAFEGDKALQLWYRDTTVRWVAFSEFRRDPGLPVVTFVEYQPHRAPQIALVDPGALRALLEGAESIRLSDWSGALAALARADSLQGDSTALVFRATVASKRAHCLAERGMLDEAQREGLRGYELWPDNLDSRYVLARVAFERGRLDEAEALLEGHLLIRPDDAGAIKLRQRVQQAKSVGR